MNHLDFNGNFKQKLTIFSSNPSKLIKLSTSPLSNENKLQGNVFTKSRGLIKFSRRRKK